MIKKDEGQIGRWVVKKEKKIFVQYKGNRLTRSVQGWCIKRISNNQCHKRSVTGIVSQTLLGVVNILGHYHQPVRLTGSVMVNRVCSGSLKEISFQEFDRLSL